MMRSLGGPAVTTALDADGGRASAPLPDDPNEPTGRWKTARLRRKVLLGAGLAWALAITAVVLVRGDETKTPRTAVPSVSPSAAPLTVPEVYQALLPSVVLIQTTRDGNPAARDQSAT